MAAAPSQPAVNPLAGKPAPASMLISVDAITRDYYQKKPDPADPRQLVSFGTSGHRGTTGDSTFTETHILAITQAIVDYRKANGVSGPLFMGKDTHALSTPAEVTALEVLAGNGVATIIQDPNKGAGGYTPTPVISWAILMHNHGRGETAGTGIADGIVITPSHNPPTDGGFKYNAINGGPADTDATGWIQNKANDYLKSGNAGVKRIPHERSTTTHIQDFVMPYVNDL